MARSASAAVRRPRCGSTVRLDDCACSSLAEGAEPSAWRQQLHFPYCQRSQACEDRLRPHAQDATIAIAYHHSNSTVRPWFKGAPLDSYLHNMRLLVRLLLSLRSVDTALPVRVLLSGERHVAFDALLASLGAKLVDADAFATAKPTWATQYYEDSFTKLRALSLTEFRRVVVLDTDAVVLQNIDELSGAQAPAFVFRPTPCNERSTLNWRAWEMNSGVMVLEPSASELGRLRRLLYSAEFQRIGHRTDPGDQSVWRHFFDEVHELPVRYNTMGTTNCIWFNTTCIQPLSAVRWDGVRVYHDVESYRRAFRPPRSTAVARALARHTSEAAMLLGEVCKREGLSC